MGKRERRVMSGRGSKSLTLLLPDVLVPSGEGWDPVGDMESVKDGKDNGGESSGHGGNYKEEEEESDSVAAPPDLKIPKRGTVSYSAASAPAPRPRSGGIQRSNGASVLPSLRYLNTTIYNLYPTRNSVLYQ